MRNLPVARIRQALGAIAVVAVVWAWSGVAAGAELVGELVSASGPVEVRPLGQTVWRVASQRIVLQPGDMVRTGPGGSAEIALVTAVIRMDENTVLVLPPPQAVPASAGNTSGVQLLLQGGRALFRVFKDRLKGTFEVITPSIIVGVKGTTFGVEQGPNLGVVVFEGIVQVAQAGRPDLRPIDVRGGQYTVLTRGGLSAPRPYEPARPGPVWNQGPTKTTSNALPAGAGRGSATGSPGTTLSQGATALAGTAPAVIPADVLSSLTNGDLVGLSVNGPADPSTGGVTGLNATSASPGLTGSDPPGVNAAGSAASSGGGATASSSGGGSGGGASSGGTNGGGATSGGTNSGGTSGGSAGSGGTNGSGPSGVSGNGSSGSNGGGRGDSDDGGRGHGRGPWWLRGFVPPGLVKFGGLPPGQGGGKK